MEYATNAITQVNEFWDALSVRYHTLGWALSVLAVFAAPPLGLTWLAAIFFAGLIVARVWHVWTKPTA